MRSRTDSSGITLIELMIVVAIIGILAAVAVYSFSKTSNRATVESEVAQVFSELHIKEGQFQMENGAYLPVGKLGSNSESDLWPVSPSGTKSTNSVAPLPASWVALRYTGDTDVYCAYAAVTGAASDSSTIGPLATASGFSAPPVDWYYLVAVCDADNDPTVNSTYLSFSNHEGMIKNNPGR